MNWNARIVPADEAAGQAARRRWDSLAKPLGSLGWLEDAVVRLAAASGDEEVCLDKRALLVFCADNGVVAQGVSQCGSQVTAKVAVALAQGRSTVNPMARLARCQVLPVDMGIRDFPGAPGVIDRRVRNGTGDISRGPAMSREECLRAIRFGAELAEARKAEGVQILCVGEMGIGNTTSACAVAAALLGLEPEDLAGRGAGLSDTGLARKKQILRQALAVNRAEPRDPVDVLAKLGGLDLAAMCGAFLGAAACRLPAVVDGAVSAAAALCAVRLCPAAGGYLLASHCSAEPMAAPLLQALDLPPLLQGSFHLGEGGGAVALLPLLDMALAVYHSGQTFEKLGIEAYTPQK